MSPRVSPNWAIPDALAARAGLLPRDVDWATPFESPTNTSTGMNMSTRTPYRRSLIVASSPESMLIPSRLMQILAPSPHFEHACTTVPQLLLIQ
ncbi:hypothetical protein SAMD00023353_0900640 [Rosellinia necatrix]|uniref:Uncharacterized protein n=1 Tax=Rosellinia necatrix TaxID=77044 RepID=A0A1S8A650_ROSNE|nr:hypothetical protein SAMD00023353_0900640 [Rosellinia necatrix]